MSCRDVNGSTNKECKSSGHLGASYRDMTLQSPEHFTLSLPLTQSNKKVRFRKDGKVVSGTVLNEPEYSSITTEHYPNLDMILSINDSLKVKNISTTSAKNSSLLFKSADGEEYDIKVKRLFLSNQTDTKSDDLARDIEIKSLITHNKNSLTLNATKSISIESLRVNKQNTIILKSPKITINKLKALKKCQIKIIADNIDIGIINLANSVNLTIEPFTPDREIDMRVTKLKLTKSVVTLSAGLYHINKINLNKRSNISIDGSVQIINHRTIVKNHSYINAQKETSICDDTNNPDNLLLYSKGLVKILNKSKIVGFIYSDKKILLNNRSGLKGAVSANNSVVVKKRSKVCYVECGATTPISSDTVPPVITLNGNADIELVYGEEYVELGATALDDVDGVVTVTTTGEVNSSKAGTYTIVYIAIDSSGNKSSIERRVKVKSDGGGTSTTITGHISSEIEENATIKIYDSNRNLLVIKSNATNSDGYFEIDSSNLSDKKNITISILNNGYVWRDIVTDFDEENIYVTHYTEALYQIIQQLKLNQVDVDFQELKKSLIFDRGIPTNENFYLYPLVKEVAKNIKSNYIEKRGAFSLMDKFSFKDYNIDAGTIYDFNDGDIEKLRCENTPNGIKINYDFNRLIVSSDIKNSDKLRCSGYNQESFFYYNIDIIPTKEEQITMGVDDETITIDEIEIVKQSGEEIKVQRSDGILSILSKEDSSKKIVGHSILNFQPSGLILNTPLEVYIPSDKEGDVYYLASDNGEIEEVVSEYDINAKRYKLIVPHFSGLYKKNYESDVRDNEEKWKSIKEDILKKDKSLYHKTVPIAIENKDMYKDREITKVTPKDIKNFLRTLVLKDGKGLIYSEGDTISFADGNIKIVQKSEDNKLNSEDNKLNDLFSKLALKFLEIIDRVILDSFAFETIEETTTYTKKEIVINFLDKFNKEMETLYTTKISYSYVSEINKDLISLSDDNKRLEYLISKIQETTISTAEKEFLSIECKYIAHKIVTNKNVSYIKKQSAIREMYEYFAEHLDKKKHKKFLENIKKLIEWEANSDDNEKALETLKRINTSFDTIVYLSPFVTKAIKYWVEGSNYHFTQLENKIKVLNKLKNIIGHTGIIDTDIIHTSIIDELIVELKKIAGNKKLYDNSFYKALYAIADNQTEATIDGIDIAFTGLELISDNKVLTSKLSLAFSGITDLVYAYEQWTKVDAIAKMAVTGSYLAHIAVENPNLTSEEQIKWYMMIQSISNSSVFSWYHYAGLNYDGPISMLLDVGLDASSTAISFGPYAGVARLFEKVIFSKESASLLTGMFKGAILASESEDKLVYDYIARNNDYNIAEIIGNRSENILIHTMKSYLRGKDNSKIFAIKLFETKDLKEVKIRLLDKYNKSYLESVTDGKGVVKWIYQKDGNVEQVENSGKLINLENNPWIIFKLKPNIKKIEIRATDNSKYRLIDISKLKFKDLSDLKYIQDEDDWSDILDTDEQKNNLVELLKEKSGFSVFNLDTYHEVKIDTINKWVAIKYDIFNQMGTMVIKDNNKAYYYNKNFINNVIDENIPAKFSHLKSIFANMNSFHYYETRVESPINGIAWSDSWALELNFSDMLLDAGLIQSVGFVDINNISISKKVVRIDENFTIDFELKEYFQKAKELKSIELWIEKMVEGKWEDQYMVKSWNNINFVANENKSFSASTYLSSEHNRTAGEYQAVVRGVIEVDGKDEIFTFGAIGDGDNFVSFEAKEKSINAPQNLNYTHSTLTWNAVDGAEGYKIIIEDSEGNILEESVTSPSFTFPSSYGGKTYSVSVVAIIDGVEGERSKSVDVEVPLSTWSVERVTYYDVHSPYWSTGDWQEIWNVNGKKFLLLANFPTTRYNRHPLYVIDDTSNGASLVSNKFLMNINNNDLVKYGDSYIYLTASDANASKDNIDIELWRLNTTTNEALKINLNDVNSSNPRDLFVFNGQLFFTATHPVHGRELWVLEDAPDGSTAHVFKNIMGDGEDSNPSNFTIVDNKFYFTAVTPLENGENVSMVWVSDGTVDGTKFITDSNLARKIVATDDNLFFTTLTTPHISPKLYKIDEETAILLKKLPRGSGDFLQKFGKNKVITGSNSMHNSNSFYISDGTTIGTSKIEFGVSVVDDIGVHILNETIFFTVGKGYRKGALMRTTIDSNVSTEIISEGYLLRNFTLFNNMLYFGFGNNLARVSETSITPEIIDVGSSISYIRRIGKSSNELYFTGVKLTNQTDIYKLTSNTQPINIADGLVAHYEFEDNANDSSGNGNNGTEHGGISYVDGVIGKAASFDGIDDWIEIKNHNLNIRDSITVSLWRKSKNSKILLQWGETCPDGNSNYKGTTLVMGLSPYYELTYHPLDENRDRFAVNITSGTGNFYDPRIFSVSTEPMIEDEYEHLAFVFKNKVLTLYKNGEIISQYHGADKGNDPYSEEITLDEFKKIFISKATIKIGVDETYCNFKHKFTDFLNGDLDDLRIYNRALSEVEIKELYELGSK